MPSKNYNYNCKKIMERITITKMGQRKVRNNVRLLWIMNYRMSSIFLTKQGNVYENLRTNKMQKNGRRLKFTTGLCQLSTLPYHRSGGVHRRRPRGWRGRYVQQAVVHGNTQLDQAYKHRHLGVC